MAISTYAELKTAVASWLHRSTLTSVIPDFIRLAESQIRRDVECRAQHVTATGTLSSSTLALPDRFLRAKRVVLGEYQKDYVTPEEFYAVRNSSTGVYTILGEDFLFQSSSGSYSIDYVEHFASLSADSDTNWLLTNAPEIYLFGSLVEAAMYLKADPALYDAKYRAAISQLKRSENRAEYSQLVVRPG